MPADAPVTHHPARLRPGAVQLKVLTRGPGSSRRARDLVTDLVFALGGGLLVWSAAIHYHLWDDGYRSIATIGPLFLLQSIAGLVIGLGLVVVRRLWAALVGIGFVLATLGGFLISVVHGLFGFEETWLAPFAQQAFALEVATAVLLGLAALLSVGAGRREADDERKGRISADRRRGRPRVPAHPSGRSRGRSSRSP